MNQISNISKLNEQNIKDSDSNRFLACEQIVELLVEKGLPNAFSPVDYITKIAKTYDLSFLEAKTCLKLAMKQIEANKPKEEKEEGEKLYAQSGYFYPQNTYTTQTKSKQDGMDSLSSLGSYNRLMFGLR